MRITIDATPLLMRSAGVKNYLYYWTRYLRRESSGIEINLFPFLGDPSVLDHERSVANSIATFARLSFVFGLLNRFPGNVSILPRGRTNIFHACKLLNPPRGAKLTATIHDLTCWLLPETHSPVNLAAERRFAGRILKRADALIAVSEATRQDAIRILKLAPEKIHVIHHGVAEMFFCVTADHVEAARSRLGLSGSYVLFVGTIEPRKNVDLLLDSYAGLPLSIQSEFELLLAGPLGWARPETIARLRHPPTGVRYLGYVAEQDLPGLMAGAAAFVYPSLYEGFGFPVAQAMAAGTPVITSAVSALPEIAGQAAVLIDPRSEDDLRQALERVLSSPSRRAEMAALGRCNARRFSWAECARQSLRFFEEVGG